MCLYIEDFYDTLRGRLSPVGAEENYSLSEKISPFANNWSRKNTDGMGAKRCNEILPHQLAPDLSPFVRRQYGIRIVKKDFSCVLLSLLEAFSVVGRGHLCDSDMTSGPCLPFHLLSLLLFSRSFYHIY